MNLGRGDGRTAGVRGARHAAPGPGVWRPGCGDRGRHHGPAAAVAAACRRAVLLLSWTGSAHGWRSPGKLGAARAVTDAGALDGARLEVAVDATGGAGGDRDRVGLPGHGGRVVVSGVPPAPAAISISPCRVYTGKIVITGPVAIVRSFGPAGRRVQDRSRFSGVLAWIGCQPERSAFHHVLVTFLVAHYVPSPISVSRPLRRRSRCRTARLGSKPGSVLIAPQPGGGLGRGPGRDLVAFGERPDRLGARAGGRRPGRPRAHDRPAGAV